MAISRGFHPEALFEYSEAANYYLGAASPRVADGFVTEVESAVNSLLADPARWRVVEDPEIRRNVFTHFPFVIYYRWEPQQKRVNVAIYHKVVETAGDIPVLVRGGGKASDEEILQRTAKLMEQGAAGMVYGRNIIQHENPAAITRALMAVVHENASAVEAMKILR